MKKLLALFAVLLVSFGAQAEKFPEDDYYTVLDLPHSEAPVVNEFFSFYCPHCNSFQPIMAEVEKSIDGKAVFEPIHVSFMGGPEGGPAMSKAFATMVALNVTHKMTPAMFDAVHKYRKNTQTAEDLRAIFTSEGISAEDFDNAYNSFAVNSMVNSYELSLKEHGINSVPALVVNNKYLVKADKIKTIEEYKELINYLVSK